MMSSWRSRNAGSVRGDYIQAVEQVFAKLTILGHFVEVEVGRREDAHIRLAGLRVANAFVHLVPG